MSLVIKQIEHKVAKQACKDFHYSKSAPNSSYKFGVWENGKFIGVVLYGKGANNMMARHFNLEWSEILELTRVALDKHTAPVSQIVMMTIKEIKRLDSKIKLIVSYADTMQNHKGTIYKAMSFYYDGLRKISGYDYFDKVEDRLIKGRSFWSKAKALGIKERELYEANLDRYEQVKKSDKHRYLFFLNKKYKKKFFKLTKEK